MPAADVSPAKSANCGFVYRGNVPGGRRQIRRSLRPRIVGIKERSKLHFARTAGCAVAKPDFILYLEETLAPLGGVEAMRAKK